MLIDQWMAAMTGPPSIATARWAATGTVDAALAQRYLAHPSSHRTACCRWIAAISDRPPREKSGWRTAPARSPHVTAAAVLSSARRLPEKPRCWIVSGGGRAIPSSWKLAALAGDATVVTATDAGFDGAAMEAEAWAYLAVRSLKGLALTYPGTTGCFAPMTGGVLARPEKRP